MYHSLYHNCSEKILVDLPQGGLEVPCSLLLSHIPYWPCFFVTFLSLMAFLERWFAKEEYVKLSEPLGSGKPFIGSK